MTKLQVRNPAPTTWTPTSNGLRFKASWSMKMLIWKLPSSDSPKKGPFVHEMYDVKSRECVQLSVDIEVTNNRQYYDMTYYNYWLSTLKHTPHFVSDCCAELWVAEKLTDQAVLCHLWQATTHSWESQACKPVIFKFKGNLSGPRQGRHHQLLFDADLPLPASAAAKLFVRHYTEAFCENKAQAFELWNKFEPVLHTLSIAWLLRSLT